MLYECSTGEAHIERISSPLKFTPVQRCPVTAGNQSRAFCHECRVHVIPYIICHPPEVAFTSSVRALATRSAQFYIYSQSMMSFGVKEFSMGDGVKHATSVAGDEQLTP